MYLTPETQGRSLCSLLPLSATKKSSSSDIILSQLHMEGIIRLVEKLHVRGHFSFHKLLAHGCHVTHLELRFYRRLLS